MTVLDFDRRQYQLLLTLLRTLGARRELTSQLGLDLSNLRAIGPLHVGLGGLVGLFVLAHPPERGYVLGLLGLTAFFLIPALVSEAADAFMNPAEASVLAHRPIRGSTYLAAKATYVMSAALMVALPLNALPALAGLKLDGTRWFFPITHLLAVSATAIFTALLACGCFGLLFRVLPLRRLRAAANWAQILVVIGIFVGPRLLRMLHVSFDLDAAYWSAVPLTWFAVISLADQSGRPVLHWWLAAPAGLAAVTVMAVGASSLSQHYMTRVIMVMRARRARAGRRGTWSGIVARAVPGGAPARAAAAFVMKMALRDWQFRRSFLLGPALIFVLLAAAVAQGGFVSPLGTRGVPGPVQFLPHLIGVVMVSACQFLSNSDHYRAGWLFLIVPPTAFRGFGRGMFWSLWTAGIALPHLALLLAGIWWWGLQDGVLFTGYSLAVASFYLGGGLRMAGGLPFTEPPRPAKAARGQANVFLLMFLVAILVAIQSFFVLHSPIATLAAALVFAVAAAAARWASLRILDVKISHSLDQLAGTRTRMFAASQADD